MEHFWIGRLHSWFHFVSDLTINMTLFQGITMTDMLCMFNRNAHTHKWHAQQNIETQAHKYPDWIGPKKMCARYFRIQFTSTRWFVQTAFVTINSISRSNLRKMLVVVSHDAIIPLMAFAFVKWWHICFYEKKTVGCEKMKKKMMEKENRKSALICNMLFSFRTSSSSVLRECVCVYIKVLWHLFVWTLSFKLLILPWNLTGFPFLF